MTLAILLIAAQPAHSQEVPDGFWDEDPALGAPELNRDWLGKIKDNTLLPDLRGRMPHPKVVGPITAATYNLYCQALKFSNIAPVEAFEKSAHDNEAVTIAHLYKSASRYRGEVIPITGQLLRLRREDAPTPLANEGVRYVYEGWIQGPTRDAPPFCVVVPSAPEDPNDPTGLLRPQETMDRSVQFYGYFIKVLLYKVEVGGKTERRYTPWLIGPKIIVTDKAPNPPPQESVSQWPFSSLLLSILAAFGGFAFAMVLGLTWWFRSGDRRFRDRLHRFHASQALETVENGGMEKERHDREGMVRRPDPADATEPRRRIET